MGGEDGQPPLPGIVRQPCQGLPGHYRLSVVPPVLVEDNGHVGQPSQSRSGQRSDPDEDHDLKLPVRPGRLRIPPSECSNRCGANVRSSRTVRVCPLHHSRGSVALRSRPAIPSTESRWPVATSITRS